MLKSSWAGLQVPKCTLSLLASSNEVKTHSRSQMRIKGLRKEERTEIFVRPNSRQNWRTLCRMMVDSCFARTSGQYIAGKYGGVIVYGCNILPHLCAALCVSRFCSMFLLCILSTTECEQRPAK